MAADVDTVRSVARYICMPDNLRIGLASVPLSLGWSVETMVSPMGKQAVAVMREALKVFVACE